MHSLFRELTSEEISFVAGGYYVPGWGWVVTGGGGLHGGGGGGGGLSGGGYDTGVDYGSGAGNLGSQPAEPLSNCQENEVDNAAWNIAKDIFSRAGGANPSIEYGSLIYRNASGGFSSTPLSPGDELRFSINLTALGISPASVVGVVHNHPIDLIADAFNPQPSPDDWATFDSLIGLGANVAQLRTYIIGPDSNVRQYDSASNRGLTSTDTIFGTQFC